MRLAILIAGLCVAGVVSAAEPAHKPPYWASISAGQARMRTGPDRAYPATWLYRRADLPVRVVAVFKQWRKVEDPDGTQGWMQANLLSATRTAIVRGMEPVPLRASPAAAAPLRFRAAPGVVGRVSHCGDGWCALDVKGRGGFIEQGALWGTDAGETLP